jgi:ELWxxDGT repeat protein
MIEERTQDSLPPRLSSWFGALILLTLAVPPTTGAAQVPELIKNINTTIGFAGDPPTRFNSVDGRVFFLLGDELWVTDGSAPESRPLCGPDPESCLAVNRLLAFHDSLVYARDADGGLWRSDGSPEGTFRLPLASALVPSAVTTKLHAGSGLLFFSAQDDETGLEPWVTDGSPEGTGRLADLEPGPEGSEPSFFRAVVLGNEVLFQASDAEIGTELWASDGTPEGTRRLDLRPGPESSFPFPLAVLGDMVILGIDDPEDRETELWVSDGTLAGTRPLSDLSKGRDRLETRLRAVDSNRLFFAASTPDDGWELWVTDGTSGGTERLTSFQTERPFDDDCCFSGEIHPIGNRVVFAADDGETGREPWISDGTREGTRVLADLCPGECDSRPGQFSTLSGRLLFAASDGASGRELWSTDGTSNGTVQVDDLCPGECDANPLPMGTTPSGLFFLAEDPLEGEELWHTPGLPGTTVRLTDFGSPNPFLARVGAALGSGLVFAAVEAESEGPELWSTDGTPEGTAAYRRISMGPVLDLGSFPHGLTASGGEVFFFVRATSSPAVSRSLWKTDGTADGTRPIAGLPASTSIEGPSALTPAGGRLFFLADTGSGNAVWVSDRTENGTRVLHESALIFPFETGMRSMLPVLGSQVFFRTLEGLWVTDGTPEGTRSVLRVSEMSSTAALLRNRLLFGASGSGRRELWTTDGTPDGTTPLRNPDNTIENPDELTSVGDRVFFVAQTPRTVERLWRTDGTSAGTVEVVREDGRPLHPFGLTAVGDRLFFFENELGGDPVKLWITDGPEAGPHELVTLSVRRELPQTVALGDLLYFLEETSEQVLWRSDGTPDGTFPVRLLPANRTILELSAVNRQLLITAQLPDDLSRTELWLSDGTGTGTRLLRIFRSQTSPGDFTVLGTQVLFRGTTAETGAELWGLDLAEDRPARVPAAPTGLEAESTPGFGARLSWHDRSDNETVFAVERRSAISEFERLQSLASNTESTKVSLPTPDYPFVFRVRAENARGASPWSNEVSVSPRTAPGSACRPSDRQLCLVDGRFRVEVRFVTEGRLREGHAVPFDFSDDSGTFWFFDPDNIELVVKVLDGTPINAHHWAFYGALSNVEYWVIVTDTKSLTNVTYHNAPGELCGRGDVTAFPRPEPGSAIRTPSPPSRAQSSRRGRGPRLVATAGPGTGTFGGCAESDTALCLNDDRFRVEVTWSDPRSGSSDQGRAIPSTDDSGFFWFFDAENVELVVKLLDGRTVNGNFWFFYGGLSDVEYTLTVTDTVEGTRKTYRNPFGDICGRADTAGFPPG